MTEQQIQKVRVKRLAHVGLWATDVAAQTRFYRQILGLHLRKTETITLDDEEESEETNTFLALGDEFHSVGLFFDDRNSSDTTSSKQASHLHHISFEVDTDAEFAALAARLNQSGVGLSLETRDGNPDLGDTLWFSDPDGNRIEISVTPEEAATSVINGGRRPQALQHLALRTINLEDMVEFYTEALGFDISDWLLRETVWLRCNTDHHTLILLQGKPEVDHLGFSISGGTDLLNWADFLGYQQRPLLWGPGRHGAGNDLFLRVADSDGIHIELSAELQQLHDRNVTTPPRLWHARPAALNLWGTLPPWLHDEKNRK